MNDDGDCTLKINGAAMSGWTEIRVTRGVEICPNSFDISLTDLFPGQATAFPMQAGDPCQLLLGSDPVITGYIDRVMPSYGPEDHSIRVTGRGKCQDLVDADAEWQGCQISNTNALDIATKLAQPYGITVTAPDGPGAQPVPQFNIDLTETPYQIIERVARFEQLLVYEGADGDLVLAQLGTTVHAGGLVEGDQGNILAGRAVFAMDERFSEYWCYMMATDVLGDIGQGGNLLAKTNDPNVKRHRRKVIIADAGAGGMQLAQARAQWEANRRAARGQSATITVDSWRDAGGVLWTPNWRTGVLAPNLKLSGQNMVVGEVTYIRDEHGTRAEITVMPGYAYSPEPILLQPVEPDLPAATPPAAKP